MKGSINSLLSDKKVVILSFKKMQQHDTGAGKMPKCSISESCPKESSIPAISQIYQSNTKFRKLFYFSVFAVSLCMSTYHVNKFLRIYFKYPVVTSIDTESELYAEFPALTICNLNKALYQHSFTLNKTNGRLIPASGRTFVISLRRYISSLSDKNSSSARQLAEEMASFNNFYSNLNDGERETVGYHVSEVIRGCKFDNKQCFYENFTLFQNLEYGNCYTFNNRKNNSETNLKSYRIGPDSGLDLTLDVGAGYYMSITPSVGMRIIIHNPYEDPDPVESGINISPDFEMQIAITKSTIRRLPPPYKDQCYDYDNGEEAFGFSSQLACVRNCTQTTSYSKCFCVDPFLPAGNELARCDLNNTAEMTCLDGVLEDMRKNGLPCKCPIACNIDYYNTELSSSAWLSPETDSFPQDMFLPVEVYNSYYNITDDYPSEEPYDVDTNFTDSYQHEFNSNISANGSFSSETNFDQDEETIISTDGEFDNLTLTSNSSFIPESKLAKLKVFFKNFDHVIYSQTPMFTNSEIISHIGGLLSFWLGLSILAFYEYLENLVLITKSVLRPHK